MHYYLSWRKGFPFLDKIYSTMDLGSFVVAYKFVCKYYYNECVSNSHICHSKLHCDLRQQASHLARKLNHLIEIVFPYFLCYEMLRYVFCVN